MNRNLLVKRFAEILNCQEKDVEAGVDRFTIGENCEGNIFITLKNPFEELESIIFSAKLKVESEYISSHIKVPFDVFGSEEILLWYIEDRLDVFTIALKGKLSEKKKKFEKS